LNAAERHSLTAIPVIVLTGIGSSWAGSQGGIVIANGLPVFALCGIVAFALNWLVFVHAYRSRTERFFDLTGGLTHAGVITLALVLAGELDSRSLILGGMAIVWAGRLASFLFTRIRREGSDGRFAEIKTSLLRFLLAWTLQGLWVLLTLASALAAITTTHHVPLGAFAIVATLVWLFGFGIEVIADRQKKSFRANPANRDRFIQHGLWAWSMHPNYFGEITLWIGVAIVAFPTLSGWQYATLISPVFAYILLTRISGIPLLTSRGENKWGHEAEYRAYRERTSILLPRPPRARCWPVVSAPSSVASNI
jgi:steroid 5-alpha reductase family enzyme